MVKFNVESVLMGFWTKIFFSCSEISSNSSESKSSGFKSLCISPKWWSISKASVDSGVGTVVAFGLSEVFVCGARVLSVCLLEVGVLLPVELGDIVVVGLIRLDQKS